MGRPTGFHIDSLIAKFVAHARILFFDIFAGKINNMFDLSKKKTMCQACLFWSYYTRKK